MVQIENEFGAYHIPARFREQDRKYLEHLRDLAISHFGADGAVLFSTDPLWSAAWGGLPGSLLSAVDFGAPGVPGGSAINPHLAKMLTSRLNEPGKSPLYVAELYTGWLSAWEKGGSVYDVDAQPVADWIGLAKKAGAVNELSSGGGGGVDNLPVFTFPTTGLPSSSEASPVLGAAKSSMLRPSLSSFRTDVSDQGWRLLSSPQKPVLSNWNLYMVVGGSNFGLAAGANLVGYSWAPALQSYDYGAPITEDGRRGVYHKNTEAQQNKAEAGISVPAKKTLETLDEFLGEKDPRVVDKFATYREAIENLLGEPIPYKEPPLNPRTAYEPIGLRREEKSLQDMFGKTQEALDGDERCKVVLSVEADFMGLHRTARERRLQKASDSPVKADDVDWTLVDEKNLASEEQEVSESSAEGSSSLLVGRSGSGGEGLIADTGGLTYKFSPHEIRGKGTSERLVLLRFVQESNRRQDAIVGGAAPTKIQVPVSSSEHSSLPSSSSTSLRLTISAVRDRVYVLTDKGSDIIDRPGFNGWIYDSHTVDVPLSASGTVDLLLETTGYVNFGWWMRDEFLSKGLKMSQDDPSVQGKWYACAGAFDGRTVSLPEIIEDRSSVLSSMVSSNPKTPPLSEPSTPKMGPLAPYYSTAPSTGVGSSSDNENGVPSDSDEDAPVFTPKSGRILRDEDAQAVNKPSFFTGTLAIADGAAVADTHLDLSDTSTFGHGYVFVNERLLGMYWSSIGPQLSIYLPAPFLRPDENRITVLELEQGGDTKTLRFSKDPVVKRPS